MNEQQKQRLLEKSFIYAGFNTYESSTPVTENAKISFLYALDISSVHNGFKYSVWTLDFFLPKNRVSSYYVWSRF